jgi:hypothetical protein
MANDKRGVGQPKKIPDSETLYNWFEAYKFWTDSNPISKMDFKGKDADEVTYKLERPLTWVGFGVWLYKNKTVSNLDEYKANKDDVYAQYSSILRVIGAEIYQNQYDGAVVGTFNQSIVARKLGLAEKSEVKTDVTIVETRIGFDPKPKDNE